jgi:hypothetical protein
MAWLAVLSIGCGSRLAWADDTSPRASPVAASRGPVSGGLIADPANPRRLMYFGGGPAFFSSVGEPEDFLYINNPGAVITEMHARGINLLYVNGFVDARYGGDGSSGANPFVGGNAVSGDIDPHVLDLWLARLQSANAAGIGVFFQLYDDLIDVLPGERLNWNLTGGNLHPQEQKYVNAVVAKLKPLKKLIWSPNEGANKTYPASYVPRWKKIASEIRRLDGFRHPIAIALVGEDDPNVTPNTGIQLYATDPNIDLYLVQHVRAASPADQYNKMLAAFNFAAGRYATMLGQNVPKPANGSDGRRKHWATAMAGAYIIQGIWDVLAQPDQDLNTLGYIAKFFKAIPKLDAMVPHNELKAGNTKYVLAVPGSSYVAYSDAATSTLGVMGLTAGTYTLKWLDTIDGSTVLQSNVIVSTSSKTFARPAGIQAECAVYIAKT